MKLSKKQKNHILGMLICVVVIAYLGVALQYSCATGQPEPFIIAIFAPFGAALGLSVGIHAWQTVFSKSKKCTYNVWYKLLILIVGTVFLFGGLVAVYLALFAVGLIPS